MSKFNHIKKKRSFLKALWYESECFQIIVVIVGMILFAILDYFLVKFEFYLLEITSYTWDSMISLAMANLCMVPLFIIIVDVCGSCILKLLKSLRSIPVMITRAVKKLSAIHNYCFIPFTEDEIQRYNFSSVDEYFDYVQKQLYYGTDALDSVECSVHIKLKDLSEMFVTCSKVFGAKEVFSLRLTKYGFIPSRFEDSCSLVYRRDEIDSFFQIYRSKLSGGSVITSSEKIGTSDTGEITMSYLFVNSKGKEKKYVMRIAFYQKGPIMQNQKLNQELKSLEVEE